MTDEDRELRGRFSQLREEDRARIPSYRTPPMRVASHGKPLARIALAAAVILIAVVLARPDRTPPNMAHLGIDLSEAAWRSPTDFLLTTPGSELLRSIPAVGSPDDWAPIDLRGRVPAPESTHSTRPPS